MLCVLQLQELRPRAKIVMVQLAYSMVSAQEPQSSDPLQSFVILDPVEYSIYVKYMQAAFAHIQASDISNIYYYAFPESVGNFTRGCIGHPSIYGNHAAANAIAPFIRKLQGW